MTPAMIIAAIAAIFLAVILIRALLFVPKDETQPSVEGVYFDRAAAQNALAALVRCKTVSYADHALEDDGEFEKLIALLPELYPHVMKACPLQRLPDRALLFHWKGRGAGEPAVLMATTTWCRWRRKTGRSRPSPPPWRTGSCGAGVRWTPR